MSSNFEPFNIESICISGKNLIEASAGTGKTYNICRIYLKAILENPKKFNVKSILVITYTNAATNELKSRIMGILKSALNFFENRGSEYEDFEILNVFDAEKSKKILHNALLNFDESNIFTIHGFCKKIIDEFNLNFSEEIIPDDSVFIEEAVKDFWRKNIVSLDENFLKYMVFEKKLSIEKLINVTERITQKVKFKVIPENFIFEKNFFLPDFKKEFGELRKNKNEILSDLDIYINDLRKILFGDVLKKNVYSDKISEKLIENFINYIKDEDTVLIPEDLRKLHPEMIKKNIKKNKIFKEKKVFPIIRELFEVSDYIKESYNEFIGKIKASLFAKIHSVLFSKKEKLNVISYNDLLFTVHNTLYSSLNGDELASKIRIKYKLAMIDEFQDTDALQYEIFKKIFFHKESAVFFIGDPKQSIYSFRGGDIFTYMRASGEVEKKYTLTKCFRSKKEIVEAVNTIFSMRTNPFVFQEIVYNKIISQQCKSDIQADNPFNIYLLQGKKLKKKDREEICANFLGSKILELRDEYGINPNDIAIVVRSNKEASFYHDKLKDFNIKSVIYGAVSVFETDEAFEMEVILKAIITPSNRKYIFSALASKIFGKTAEQIRNLQENDAELESMVFKFINYQDKWLKSGFMAMFYYLIEENSILEKIMQFRNGERKITNLLHTAELIHKACEREKLTLDGALKWLNERRTGFKNDSEYELRLDSDENAVEIVTIHKSKGLEYRFLFCPFIGDKYVRDSEENGIFYHNEEYELILDMNPGENSLEKEKNEMFSETIRLFYVALTRAIVQCNVIVYKDETKGIENSVFDYLTEGNENSLKKYFKIVEKRDLSSLKFNDSELLNDKLNFDPFSGKIERSYITDSFTRISFRRDNEKFDENNISFLKEEETPNKDIFSFPKGVKAGIFFHKILEHLDFTTDDKGLEKIVKDELNVFFPELFDWFPIVSETLRKLLNMKLETPEKESVILKNVKNSDKISELEFYLSLESESNFLYSVVADVNDKFGDYLKKLNAFNLKTYLRGFIDLVFEANGKYYIIDWKSNYLGDSYTDYKYDKLENIVMSNLYFLQYYIYSAAFYNYLKLKDNSFNYHRFGGVFYIFLRGLGEDSGVFFDKPSARFLENFNTEK